MPGCRGAARLTSSGQANRSRTPSGPRIHTFIATSDLHLERKLRISRDQCFDALTAAVKQARGYTDDVEFSAEDATRTDMEFLCRAVEAAIGLGATTINLPDTVGYLTPDEIEDFFTQVRTRVPNRPTKRSSAPTATMTWDSLSQTP